MGKSSSVNIFLRNMFYRGDNQNEKMSAEKISDLFIKEKIFKEK